MHQVSRTVIERVNEDRLRDLTLELLKIPSPTGDEGAAVESLAKILRDIGLDVEIVIDDEYPKSPSLIARLRGRRPGPTLQFDGHIDTIHLAHDPPYYDPINRRIYGRGAADMKGSLAAITEAVHAIKESGVELEGDVVLVIHGMHEAPWAYGETLYRLIERGYTGNAVVVMEGLSNQVAVIGKGAGIFEIDIRWESGGVHQGFFGRIGISPTVAAASRLVQAFEERNAELAKVEIPYVGPELYFVGILHLGDFYNRIPNHCHIEGCRRYGPDHTFLQIQNEFLEIVDKVAKETGTKIEARITHDRGPFRINPEEPVVRAIQAAYKDVFGKPLPLGGMMACADAPPYVAAGVPATYYAPNQERAHADIEYAFMDSLLETSRIYALTVLHYFLLMHK